MPLFLRRRSYDAKEENFFIAVIILWELQNRIFGYFTPNLSEGGPSRLDNAVFVNLR
jgi:hypothetical protein